MAWILVSGGKTASPFARATGFGLRDRWILHLSGHACAANLFRRLPHLLRWSFVAGRGCPPEIDKVLTQRGLKAPNVILLPDRPPSPGESQAEV
jgi:hypothetical protein